MSLLADYYKEREGFESVETEGAFATYKIEGNECYLRDIYVVPHLRKKGVASRLADEVAKRGREKGATFLIGTVDPTAGGATTSMKALLGYGFTLDSINGRLIVLTKEIGEEP